MLQTASRETTPILKRVLLELTLGHSPMCIWVLVTEIMDKFILGLDFLCTYDAFMDLGCHML
jgi:hypothetical protein